MDPRELCSEAKMRAGRGHRSRIEEIGELVDEASHQRMRQRHSEREGAATLVAVGDAHLTRLEQPRQAQAPTAKREEIVVGAEYQCRGLDRYLERHSDAVAHVLLKPR